MEEARTVISFSSTLPFGSPVGRNNTALLGVDPDDPDVRAILENDYIKNLLSSLRSYDTPGAPLTPEVKALRQLDAEASSDLSWWQQFFNPTFDLESQRFELSPLSSFLLAHPEFLLGPASLARQAVKTAACIALQRVAPKLLAASGAALAWENFVSFMKGGKNAVKKTTAGEAKPRLGTSGYKDGGFWGGLYDNAKGLQNAGVNPKKAQEMYGDYKHLKRIDRGGEIRMDKDGNFYKYDRAHQSAKIHLEKIVKRSDGFWNVAEVDPETGTIIRTLKNRPVGK